MPASAIRGQSISTPLRGYFDVWNQRRAVAPQTVIDYLVVHKPRHFRHRDHTDAFWNEVDKMMPDFRERKEWLREYDAGLDIRILGAIAQLSLQAG